MRLDAKNRKLLFEKQQGKCCLHGCQMTLDKGINGRPPKNYASFEHLKRRYEGGDNRRSNIALSCMRCNSRRKHKKIHYTKPENVAARKMTNDQLLRGFEAGTFTKAGIGQLYSRGLIVNWPMWTKLMWNEPLWNP